MLTLTSVRNRNPPSNIPYMTSYGGYKAAWLAICRIIRKYDGPDANGKAFHANSLYPAHTLSGSSAVMAPSQTTAEYSAGGVVFRPTESGYEFVAVQRARHGDWSLPKGHIEAGESKEEAAIREVKEETGIEARIVGDLQEVVYFYRRSKEGLTRKSVQYYLMEALTDELGGPNWEVSESRWVDMTKADSLLSYANDKATIGLALKALDEMTTGENSSLRSE
jgi:8-oxo-dGTP diphosphatase